jgi:(R,R)-butanediol dehydrogenase / meso-butanediol dehydrogenase / diacetyl reductase
MRALVWHGPERMSVDELPDPEPGSGEVLLVPEAAGICGSDLEGYLGLQGNRTPPLVMGHEFAGRVAAVGEGVDPRWRDRRAAVNPLVPGDEAPAGIEHLSRRRELLGVHRPGGFASAVRVPARQLRALPDGADARLGVLAEPLANGVHAARIGRAGVEGGPTERAVVIGAGTIGLMTLQAAVLGGAAWVGVLEPQEHRRAVAERLGATVSFPTSEELGSAAGEQGVDLVFDAVGAETTRRLAVELLRPGGCAVMVGLATDAVPVPFHTVIRQGLTLRGSYAYTADDYDEALAWLLDGRAGLGELEAVQPLTAGPEAFAELAAGPSPRLKVFLAAEPA